MIDSARRAHVATYDDERVKEWSEDPCLRMLGFFSVCCRLQASPARERLQEWMMKHESDCGQGRCPSNVRATAERTTEPLKKLFYLETLQQFVAEWVRADGGVYEVLDDEAGRRTVLGWPREMGLPYVRQEVFEPTNPNLSGEVVFEVSSKEVFDDPRLLEQHLDVTATRDVKRFDKPGLEGLYWRCIVGDRKLKLTMRWQGNVKLISDDWRLYARYENLLKEHVKEEPTDSSDWINSFRRQRSMGLEVLNLRRHALDYDETQARFSGFLKTTLGFRRKDEYNHAVIDVLNRSTSYDKPVAKALEKQVEVERSATLQNGDPTETWKTQHEDRMDSLSFKESKKRLLNVLTPRQREIFAFKGKDLSDKDIGRRLGLVRETVNRELAKIRKKAAKLEG